MTVMISLKKESESRKIPHRSQIGSQIGSVCHSCLGAGPYLCRGGVGAGGEVKAISDWLVGVAGGAKPFFI